MTDLRCKICSGPRREVGESYCDTCAATVSGGLSSPHEDRISDPAQQVALRTWEDDGGPNHD